jgi:hypothetical protein
MDYITVDDGVRALYADNPEYLDALLNDIDVRLRNFHQSLLGRDARLSPPRIHIVTVPQDLDKTDPWHDQGNATNHRLSGCTEDCAR